LSLCTFGFLYPLSSGIADICVFLDEAIASPETDPFIDSVFSCNNNSILHNVSNISNLIVETAGNLTCDIFTVLSEASYFCDNDGDGKINVTDKNQTCPFIYTETTENCTSETFSIVANSTKIYNWSIGCFCPDSVDPDIFVQQWECGDSLHSLFDYPDSSCPKDQGCLPMYCMCNKPEEALVSVEECSVSCTDYNLAANATRILNFTKIAGDIFDLYNNTIKLYFNCDSVVGITNRARDFICINMMNSVTPMFVGEIVSAAGTFVGTFVAILATKRFRRKYRRKYAILKEGHADIEL